jgi:MATE family multidrug resistance protein
MDELKALWKLAFPIIVAQVGFFGMGLVDTLLIGPMGAEALSALALGNTFFFGVMILGIGLMMGLDPWVSQAFGAGKLERCSQGLVQGCWLAVIATPPLVLAMSSLPWALGLLGYDEHLLELAKEYLGPLRWAVLPGLLFATYKSYISAVSVTRPLLWVALLANACNIGLDLWFIHGGLGVPPLGVTGVAWSTTFCRLVLFLPLFLLVRYSKTFEQFPKVDWRPSPKLLRTLSSVGLPVGLQYLVEVGAFCTATVLMGIKGETQLAAHQVALNITALFFMVSLSLGAAGSVRVGQNLGAGNLVAMRRAGWTALGSGLCYAMISTTLIVLFSAQLIGLYRVDAEIFTLAVQFLAIAAIFQLGDSVQAVAVGVLRGLADTRVPLVMILASYWFVAIPIGVLGAFVLGDDPLWIWYGLAVGLCIVSVLLVSRFRWKVVRVTSGLLDESSEITTSFPALAPCKEP